MALVLAFDKAKVIFDALSTLSNVTVLPQVLDEGVLEEVYPIRTVIISERQHHCFALTFVILTRDLLLKCAGKNNG